MFTISSQVGKEKRFKSFEGNPSWAGNLWLPTQTCSSSMPKTQTLEMNAHISLILLSSLCLLQDFRPRVESFCVPWTASFEMNQHRFGWFPPFQTPPFALHPCLVLHVLWFPGRVHTMKRKTISIPYINSSHLDIITAHWNKWVSLILENQEFLALLSLSNVQWKERGIGNQTWVQVLTSKSLAVHSQASHVNSLSSSDFTTGRGNDETFLTWLS